MIDVALLNGIRQADKVLCVSHISPDGDAVGSLLGMGYILRALGKNVTLALQDDVPEQLLFLPATADIVDADSVSATYDLIICLDASSPDRMGEVFRSHDHKDIPLFVIDHHVTNTYFGTYNWVEPDCAATCQMLIYLADALNIPLTGELAESLLTGLVTDTLCFRTSNTDSLTLEAAMRLTNGGANLNQITEQALNRRPLSMLRLWGMSLSNLQLEDGVIWTTITRAQLEAAGHVDGDTQLSGTLITTAEADISASFLEIIDESGRHSVDCSFRAKPGFDVSKVAFALGGGGHPAAAGCTIQGLLEDIVPRVVERLKEAREAAKITIADGPT